MLEYIGHPYFDVGIATLAAFVGKRNPHELTKEDLSVAVAYIEREYVRQPMRGYLHGVVFMNSGFGQPAYIKDPEKQQEYAANVLHGYKSEIPTTDEKCVFTGKPAVAISLDVKGLLPHGRAFRQHIPLLTGENVINFHPYGDAGLPVSGEAMLAIQTFPLGCARSGGRLLVVHSDNPDITYHFASTFLEQNRKAIQFAQAAGDKAMPAPHLKHRTLLIETLLQATVWQHHAIDDEQLFSITAYHLSNSGQSPKLDIYHLPIQVVMFLREMETAKYHQHWHRIVARAWEVEPKSKATKGKDNEPFQPTRNWLYEDLFDVQKNANRFIRTYFLRAAIRSAQGKTDPRQNYSLNQEADLVSWDITARFLRRILNVETHRIEQIKRMGDGFADYVSSQNDRRFFRDFVMIQNYDHLRTSLIKANLNHVKAGNSPILTFEPFIEVFEDGNEQAHREWKLARDLVLIRMIEQLHMKGWLRQNQDTVEELMDDEAE